MRTLQEVVNYQIQNFVTAGFTNNRLLAKVLLIKFWDAAQSHPTRKKIFVGRCSEHRPNYFCKKSNI